mmetsp:Transcript_4461/g.10743  ORF Transcript_4461/g.10743 Transcript_4461/m.10743 type:complete len:88 (+) Transcript_4461:142-405(+)
MPCQVETRTKGGCMPGGRVGADEQGDHASEDHAPSPFIASSQATQYLHTVTSDDRMLQTIMLHTAATEAFADPGWTVMSEHALADKR